MAEATEGKDQKSFEEMLLTDPDSLPSDPDELAALIERESSAGDPADAVDPDADATAKADADAKAKADADAAAKADADAKAKTDADAAAKADAAKQADPNAPKPDGVALKDGKTIIPYHVLETTRRREDTERRARAEAETARKVAEERVTVLQDEVDSLKRGEGVKSKDTNAADALREKIDALKEQVPEVGVVLDAMTEKLNATSDELATLRAEREDEAARHAAAVRSTVQQVVDANPVLRYWQNENVDLYNEAAKLDQQLRTSPNPDIRALPMEKRFDKVVEMLEALHGKTDLPEAYRPKADPSKTATDPATKKPGQDVQVDPKVKLPEKPITLSDLPGGVSPATRKSTDQMSVAEADAEVQRMLDKGMKPMDILAALELPGE